MADLKDLLQSADWKTEKHVPVIDCLDKINKGQTLQVEVSVGKQIAHPNTTEHHIRSIELYFLATGEKFRIKWHVLSLMFMGSQCKGPIPVLYSLSLKYPHSLRQIKVV